MAHEDLTNAMDAEDIEMVENSMDVVEEGILAAASSSNAGYSSSQGCPSRSAAESAVPFLNSNLRPWRSFSVTF